MDYIMPDDRIRMECHKILSDNSLLMMGDTTYCNIAAYRILDKFNLAKNFWNQAEKRIMLANEMYEILEKNYVKVNMDEVDNYSNMLLVACKDNQFGHGHIAVIYPNKCKMISKKWGGIEVPFCANVGYINAIIGLNYAFSDKPNIYIIGEVQKVEKEAIQ